MRCFSLQSTLGLSKNRYESGKRSEIPPSVESLSNTTSSDNILDQSGSCTIFLLKLMRHPSTGEKLLQVESTLDKMGIAGQKETVNINVRKEGQ